MLIIRLKINYNHLAIVMQTKEGTTHTHYPFIYISVWWFQHTLIHMTHSHEEQNKSVKPSWLMYVSIKLLWYVWPMITINVTKVRAQTFGEECLAPSGNRTTVPRSSNPCHRHCINWVLCRKGPTFFFFLKKKAMLHIQYIQGVQGKITKLFP